MKCMRYVSILILLCIQMQTHSVEVTKNRMSGQTISFRNGTQFPIELSSSHTNSPLDPRLWNATIYSGRKKRNISNLFGSVEPRELFDLELYKGGELQINKTYDITLDCSLKSRPQFNFQIKVLVKSKGRGRNLDVVFSAGGKEYPIVMSNIGRKGKQQLVILDSGKKILLSIGSDYPHRNQYTFKLIETNNK